MNMLRNGTEIFGMHKPQKPQQVLFQLLPVRINADPSRSERLDKSKVQFGLESKISQPNS